MAYEPTRYEVIAESADGCTRKLLGYIERNSRHGLRDFVRGELAHGVMVAFGGSAVSYAKKAADGFVVEDKGGEPVAAIRFSGRTEREAASSRLPMFGQPEGCPHCGAALNASHYIVDEANARGCVTEVPA